MVERHHGALARRIRRLRSASFRPILVVVVRTNREPGNGLRSRRRGAAVRARLLPGFGLPLRRQLGQLVAGSIALVQREVRRVALDVRLRVDFGQADVRAVALDGASGARRRRAAAGGALGLGGLGVRACRAGINDARRLGQFVQVLAV